MEVAEAHSLIARAIESGRPANGYLLVGDIGASGLKLVDLILNDLFPGQSDRLASHSHPDVIFLEPQGKSRTIKVERGKEDSGPGMRDGLIEPMSTTSFSGGWKVGVIIGADRMQSAAANAFLKSLEEPTPKTMYLLLTDSADAILPTIISRTQRIDLPRANGLLVGDSYASVAEIFECESMGGVYERAQAAKRLAEILSELKDAAEDESAVVAVRRQFFLTLVYFVRGWMISGLVPRHAAFRNIEAVEEAYRQSEKSIGDDAILAFLLDRLTFPGNGR